MNVIKKIAIIMLVAQGLVPLASLTATPVEIPYKNQADAFFPIEITPGEAVSSVEERLLPDFVRRVPQKLFPYERVILLDHNEQILPKDSPFVWEEGISFVVGAKITFAQKRGRFTIFIPIYIEVGDSIGKVKQKLGANVDGLFINERKLFGAEELEFPLERAVEQQDNLHFTTKLPTRTEITKKEKPPTSASPHRIPSPDLQRQISNIQQQVDEVMHKVTDIQGQLSEAQAAVAKEAVD